jgi:hypothetical protein
VETRGNAGGARLWQGPHWRVGQEITVGGGDGGGVKLGFVGCHEGDAGDLL